MKKYETVAAAIAAEFDGYPFSDNFRSAEVGNAEEMEDYIKRMRSGCCGRRDIVVMIEQSVMLGDEIHKWHAPYLLGCNYGH